MANKMPVDVFAREVAERLRPDDIDVELLAHDSKHPGLLSCRRAKTGRTVFLLADAADCSHAKAAIMADYVRQEIPPA
jgi:hypothetical protein